MQMEHERNKPVHMTVTVSSVGNVPCSQLQLAVSRHLGSLDNTVLGMCSLCGEINESVNGRGVRQVP